MSRKFARHIEDFTCLHCGAFNHGDGYTNHCQECLYSRHVDVNPGDRAHECQGLMEPVSVLWEKARYVIVHQCLRCGQQMRCKSSPRDDREKLHEIMTRRAQDFWQGGSS